MLVDGKKKTKTKETSNQLKFNIVLPKRDLICSKEQSMNYTLIRENSSARQSIDFQPNIFWFGLWL